MDLGDESVRLCRPDLAEIDEWMAGEDAEQIRGFEFPGPAPRENVIRAFREWSESWSTNGPVRHWSIYDVNTGRLMGGVDVREVGDGEVNLSYVVFPDFRKRGVAARSSRLALTYAAREMGARTAVVKVLEDNAASLGVARRLAAVETGTEASETGATFIVFRLDLSAFR